MAIIKITNSKKSLSGILNYIMNEEKTEVRLVSGQDCMPESAAEEMTVIKEMYSKNHGRQYIHIVQSFDPKDALDHATAHEIGRRLAAWFSGFQTVIATHKDKNHIHNHVILNSVNMKTGMKFQQSREDLRRVKEYSNALCAEYGLSTIRIEKTGNSLDYGEWRGEKQGVSWRSMLKADIDQALQYCLKSEHFIPQMRARGYEVKHGQHLAFRAPGQQRFIRLDSLGTGYSEVEIIQRISRQEWRSGYRNRIPKPVVVYSFRRSGPRQQGYYPFKTVKLRGLRALYWRYLYMLGKVKKHEAPKPVQRVVSREDIIKFHQIREQFYLLERNMIETREQLETFKSTTVQRVDELVGQRTTLHREKKNVTDTQPYVEQITAANAELRRLRRDLRTADRVQDKSEQIRRTLAAVQVERLREREARLERRRTPVRARDRNEIIR